MNRKKSIYLDAEPAVYETVPVKLTIFNYALFAWVLFPPILFSIYIGNPLLLVPGYLATYISYSYLKSYLDSKGLTCELHDERIKSSAISCTGTDYEDDDHLDFQEMTAERNCFSVDTKSHISLYHTDWSDD